MRETLATILWEGWTALVLCAAAVFLPGSEARDFYISRRALARAGTGGCCAYRLGVLGAGRAARAPAPGTAAGKTKTPVSGSRYRGFVRQSIT